MQFIIEAREGQSSWYRYSQTSAEISAYEMVDREKRANPHRQYRVKNSDGMVIYVL